MPLILGDVERLSYWIHSPQARLLRLHRNHKASVATVNGTERAQNIQKSRDTTSDDASALFPGSKEKKLILKSVCEIYVVSGNIPRG